MSKRRRGWPRKPGGGTARIGAARHAKGSAPLVSSSPAHGPAPSDVRVVRSRRIVRHIDSASVLKFSACFYLTLACIVFVAGVVLWLVATMVGVRENVERFIGDLIASNKFHFVGWEVLRVSAVAAVVIVIIGTAFNLFLAVVYNLISEIVGGMAIIVDDERTLSSTASPSASPPLLPPAEIADIFQTSRSPDDVVPMRAAPSAAAPPTAAASPARAAESGKPQQQSEGSRATARWVPKRGRQV